MSRGFAIIAFWHPKTADNVGMAARSAHAFGVAGIQVIGARFPRMRTDVSASWKHLPIVNVEDLLVPEDTQIIGVEITSRSKPLPTFPHPQRALYVFGPEDGSLPNTVTDRCQDLLIIPGERCLNLAMAVTVVLYDRVMKSGRHLTPRPMTGRERYSR